MNNHTENFFTKKPEEQNRPQPSNPATPADLARLHKATETLLSRIESAQDTEGVQTPYQFEWPDFPPGTSLGHMTELFGLSAFEQQVLLLALAAEEHLTLFRRLCAHELGGEASVSEAQLSPLMLRRWCLEADLTSLEDAGTLFTYGLLRSRDTGLGRNLRALTLTPGAYRCLLGLGGWEGGLLNPLGSSGGLSARQNRDAETLAGALRPVSPRAKVPGSRSLGAGFGDGKAASRVPLANVYGDVRGALDVVGSAFAQAGWPAYQVRLNEVVQQAGLGTSEAWAQLDELVRDVLRESAWRQLALVVVTEDRPEVGKADADKIAARSALTTLLQGVRGPFVVVSREPLPLPTQQAVTALEVARPTPHEQFETWARALGLPVAQVEGRAAKQLGRLAGQFDLSGEQLWRVGRDARAALAQLVQAQAPHLQSVPDDKELVATEERRLVLIEQAWVACRRAGRSAMAGARPLAEHLSSQTEWDDLILPAADQEVLREMVLHVRERHAVQRLLGAGAWREGGIVALFSGPSGTGKTYAAEVLARELELDLYRVDLSQLSSKWIGETEKNLAKLFDAADEGGVVLLFDEADSVFGKRGDGGDAGGRHANMQTNYLLQRLEAYRGLAILTTNLPRSIDSAFLRRIRFELSFREPGTPERLLLWQRAFPAGAPLGEVDFLELAQLKLTGANIKRAALHALYLSAAQDAPIDQVMLRLSTKRELRKLGRLSLDLAD